MLRSLAATTAALAAVLVLAGCGGGSGGGTKDTSGVAAYFDADRSWTPEQLTAALPTRKDVPGGKRALLRCDFGRVTAACPPAPSHTYASVVFGTPLAGRPVTPTRPDTWWRAEERRLVVEQYAGEDSASAALDEQYAAVETLDGDYETPASGEAWGGRGKGTVSRDDAFGLAAVRADATQVDVDAAGATSRPMQVSVLVVAWGRQRLTARVVFFDDEHERGEAAGAARALVDDYLARLRAQG